MDPNSCDWGWRTNETAPVRAEITGSVNTAVSTAKIQTIPDPPVDIVAACTIPAQGTVEGQGDLLHTSKNYFLGWGKRTVPAAKNYLQQVLNKPIPVQYQKQAVACLRCLLFEF